MSIRKLAVLVPLAAAGIALAACSSSNGLSPAPHAKPAPHTSAQAPAASQPDSSSSTDTTSGTLVSDYLGHRPHSDAPPTDPHQIMSLGHQVCAALDSGETVDQYKIKESGWAVNTYPGQSDQVAGNMGVLMVYAVYDLCPQYMPQVRAAANTW